MIGPSKVCANPECPAKGRPQHLTAYHWQSSSRAKKAGQIVPRKRARQNICMTCSNKRGRARKRALVGPPISEPREFNHPSRPWLVK